MTVAELYAWLGAILFVIACAMGIRASIRLRRRYNRTKALVDERNRLITAAVVVACYLLTVTVGWIGTLTLIRITTATTFPFAPPITLFLSTLVVFIPVLFDEAYGLVEDPRRDSVVSRVARRILRR